MAALTNSTRAILKATYTQVRPPAVSSASDRTSVFSKLNFMRTLQVSQPELVKLREHLREEQPDLLGALDAVEPSLTDPSPAAAASNVAAYAELAPWTLVGLAREIDALRTDGGAEPKRVTRLRVPGSQPVVFEPAKGWSVPPPAERLPVPVIVDRFLEEADLEPVGWLHLERIEMQPVGLERGELVATVPMAPGETVRVSHKEWSTQSEELSRIVTDELETYSEKGVSEKTDVAMSSTTESKRDTNLNFGVTASGSYGPVSVTSTVNAAVSTSEHDARQTSARHAKEITSKASSRSRKEHKVSFRTETRRGEEEEAARVITNSTGKVMRIDYYRMMRKWRVDLMRYGLRMTYDLVVPDPGATLRRQLLELAEIDRTLATPFRFDFRIDQVTRDNWQTLAARFAAAVTGPPQATLSPPDYTYEFPAKIEEIASITTRYESWRIEVPPGYELRPTTFEVNYYGYQPADLARFEVIGDEVPQVTATPVGETEFRGRYVSTLLHLAGKGGQISIQYTHRNVSWAGFRLATILRLSDAAFQAWQLDTWQKLREAAEQQYYSIQQRARDRREQLLEELNRDDTLTLRRMEREEIMKRAMQWLFGNEFDVAPDDIDRVLAGFGAGAGPTFADDVDPSTLPVGDEMWLAVRKFGEFIKFLHQAVEWENVLYFLYPYFWGSEQLGETKRLLWHPDPLRREFLRAGAARIVLPIRPGFERPFSRLMQTGSLREDDEPAGDVTYLTVAAEMEAYARTNYPGIPPANPDIAARARPLVTVTQQRAWQDISRIVAALEDYATKAKQQVDPSWQGAPIEPQFYPTTAQGLQVLLAGSPGLPVTDPWGRPYQYANPGRTAPFRVWTLGADGAVGGVEEASDISTDAEGNIIGTWFEYTPCSGLDIEVGSDLNANG